MTTTTPNDLKHAAEEAPWHLLHCPRCDPKRLASQWKPHTKYGWGLQLVCPVCHMNWTVCRRCASQRIHMVDTTSQSRHQRIKHSDVATDKPIPLVQKRKKEEPSTSGKIAKQRTSESEPKPQETQKPRNHLVIPNGLFDRGQSNEFFQHQVNDCGLRYLFALSNFGRTDVLDAVTEEDTEIFSK